MLLIRIKRNLNTVGVLFRFTRISFMQFHFCAVYQARWHALQGSGDRGKNISFLLLKFAILPGRFLSPTKRQSYCNQRINNVTLFTVCLTMDFLLVFCLLLCVKVIVINVINRSIMLHYLVSNHDFDQPVSSAFGKPHIQFLQRR